jgi:hypothetical protein
MDCSLLFPLFCISIIPYILGSTFLGLWVIHLSYKAHFLHGPNAHPLPLQLAIGSLSLGCSVVFAAPWPVKLLPMSGCPPLGHGKKHPAARHTMCGNSDSVVLYGADLFGVDPGKTHSLQTAIQCSFLVLCICLHSFALARIRLN